MEHRQVVRFECNGNSTCYYTSHTNSFLPNKSQILVLKICFCISRLCDSRLRVTVSVVRFDYRDTNPWPYGSDLQAWPCLALSFRPSGQDKTFPFGVNLLSDHLDPDEMGWTQIFGWADDRGRDPWADRRGRRRQQRGHRLQRVLRHHEPKDPGHKRIARFGLTN